MSQKCFYSLHQNKEACSQCLECSKFLCKECVKMHRELHVEHHLNSITENNKKIYPIFTGYCGEANHNNCPLDFYCKSHNKLCCCVCLCKLDEYGTHNACEVEKINEVIFGIKNKLNYTIRTLEEKLYTFNNNINELETIKDLTNKKKEILIEKIENHFSEIKTKIDQRKDDLIKEVDEKYSNILKKFELILNNENKNKILEKCEASIILGKEADKFLDVQKNKEMVQYYIYMEENINNLTNILKDIESYKSINNAFDFSMRDEDTIKHLINELKFSGNIIKGFRFKEYTPFNKVGRYLVTGQNKATVIKTENSSLWVGIVTENCFLSNSKTVWYITINKSLSNNILIGVAPHDLNIGNIEPYYYGWYFFVNNSTLFSGPPQKYKCHQTKFKLPKDYMNETKEIKVIFNNKNNQGELSFVINGECPDISYNNIPLNHPLCPAVCLLNYDDSVSISQ